MSTPPRRAEFTLGLADPPPPGESEGARLALRGVSAGYAGTDVIHGIDLTVRAGEIVTLIGANGAGKSTLVKTISGLVPVRSGTITFAGRRIERDTTAARMRLGIVHVPEGRQ